jgi:hypothetical protein
VTAAAQSVTPASGTRHGKQLSAGFGVLAGMVGQQLSPVQTGADEQTAGAFALVIPDGGQQKATEQFVG